MANELVGEAARRIALETLVLSIGAGAVRGSPDGLALLDLWRQAAEHYLGQLPETPMTEPIKQHLERMLAKLEEIALPPAQRD